MEKNNERLSPPRMTNTDTTVVLIVVVVVLSKTREREREREGVVKKSLVCFTN